MAATAGVLGGGAAAVAGAVLRLAGGGAGVTPVLPLAYADLLWLIPCPAIAAAAAALTARRTVLALLRSAAL